MPSGFGSLKSRTEYNIGNANRKSLGICIGSPVVSPVGVVLEVMTTSFYIVLVVGLGSNRIVNEIQISLTTSGVPQAGVRRKEGTTREDCGRDWEKVESAVAHENKVVYDQDARGGGSWWGWKWRGRDGFRLRLLCAEVVGDEIRGYREITCWRGRCNARLPLSPPMSLDPKPMLLGASLEGSVMCRLMRDVDWG